MNVATIIATEVARVTNVPVREILSARRDKNTVVARHMCIVLMREFTPWGTPTIARALRMYDHTTVRHAIQTWPTRVERNPLAERIGQARSAVSRKLAKQREAMRIHAEANGHVVS